MNALSQHTPGPWATNAIDGKPNAAAVWTADGRLFICSTNRPPTRLHSAASELAQHANCCLIAAAPDLLAALKQMVDVPGGEGGDFRAIAAARAAIAKATGEGA